MFKKYRMKLKNSKDCRKRIMQNPLIPYLYRSIGNIAHIMYQKYVNAEPLYRQKQIGEIWN